LTRVNGGADHRAVGRRSWRTNSALRLRLVDIRLAVAVAVLGAIGPFIGSAEFLRQDRRRTAP